MQLVTPQNLHEEESLSEIESGLSLDEPQLPESEYRFDEALGIMIPLKTTDMNAPVVDIEE
jgi:hypothetical protein